MIGREQGSPVHSGWRAPRSANVAPRRWSCCGTGVKSSRGQDLERASLGPVSGCDTGQISWIDSGEGHQSARSTVKDPAQTGLLLSWRLGCLRLRLRSATTSSA